MASLPAQLRFDVYPATQFCVDRGANEGDALGTFDEVEAGDIYRFRTGATPLTLAMRDTVDGAQVVAEGSQLGRAGDPLTIEACHQLMTPDGTLAEVLTLTIWPAGQPAHYILPLCTLKSGEDYELVGTEAETARLRFADIACISFLSGTQITLASGAQTPVEALQVGDVLLTRDNGAQPIRWIGRTVLRGTGSTAPVLIRQGALNAARDLVLMPNHRLFLWQRTDVLEAGRAQVMVKAAHLINGTTIIRKGGGFFDGFHILLDRHEIIYAEGIAVESLMVTGQTRPILPNGISTATDPDFSPEARAALELDPSALRKSGQDPATALQNASLGGRKPVQD